jgi:hypothetical protein
MQDAIILERIRQKYLSLLPVMDERVRRLWAASEATAIGRGGVSLVVSATGMSRNTIVKGQRELEVRKSQPDSPVGERIRAVGGGRKLLQETDPTLLADLDSLVDPVTRGDPESPLRWTSKSTRKLAKELQQRGHVVSDRTVASLLIEYGYSLQGNRKTTEGRQHPDRNAQFEHIHGQVLSRMQHGQPVISVDTKKKELVGEFKNSGVEWQAKGKPEKVNVHDFPDPNQGKAVPYGVYDLTTNEGWVSVGINHDTAQFAVNSVLRWWKEMGAKRFPRARELMITADGGGSNSSRSRLWKVALQGLADDTGLTLHICHFPPGTSKWNKIEHRMFSFITKNWRGRPLTSYAAIVNLISNTTTAKGLIVKAALDRTQYETGIKVSDEELSRVLLTRSEFHGEWNYSIKPRKK